MTRDVSRRATGPRQARSYPRRATGTVTSRSSESPSESDGSRRRIALPVVLAGPGVTGRGPASRVWAETEPRRIAAAGGPPRRARRRARPIDSELNGTGARGRKT
jgi:hypothetical protein